jgi:hypothetical protein
MVLTLELGARSHDRASFSLVSYFGSSKASS